eukprot:Sspe_Gene.63281::Locus_36113_Transcript_1_1_Confidence_1.000_Length_609::g.63281::m.63281
MGRKGCWSKGHFLEAEKGGLKCNHCGEVVLHQSGSRTKKHLAVCSKAPKDVQERAKNETKPPGKRPRESEAAEASETPPPTESQAELVEAPPIPTLKAAPPEPPESKKHTGD